MVHGDKSVHREQISPNVGILLLSYVSLILILGLSLSNVDKIAVIAWNLLY